MRVLLVEDDHKIAGAIKRGLEQESYAVDLAYDGDSGADEALSGEHDLIILDRMLPGDLDGVEICRQIRRANLHTPILMLTAKDQVRDRVTGLDAGADDYMAKPFSIEELLARLRALLRRPKEDIGQQLIVRDLVLDLGTHQVKRAGREIRLSVKEFALLEYLLRHVGIVQSKETLISHVWNFDADILPNTVEVYIGYLRSKIDKPFKGPELIKTVHGFGYKIEA